MPVSSIQASSSSATWRGSPVSTGPRPPRPMKRAASPTVQRRVGSAALNEASAVRPASVSMYSIVASSGYRLKSTPVQPDNSVSEASTSMWRS